MKRWASTAIKLTISPTVDSFLAAFDMTRALRKMAEIKAVRIRRPTKNIRWKYWARKSVWVEAMPNKSPAKRYPRHVGWSLPTKSMRRRRICGEAKVKTSWNNFRHDPNRKVPPKALISAGKMLACFFSFSFVKLTLADDFLNVADAIPFAGTTTPLALSTDLFQ